MSLLSVTRTNLILVVIGKNLRTKLELTIVTQLKISKKFILIICSQFQLGLKFILLGFELSFKNFVDLTKLVIQVLELLKFCFKRFDCSFQWGHGFSYGCVYLRRLLFNLCIYFDVDVFNEAIQIFQNIAIIFIHCVL